MPAESPEPLPLLELFLHTEAVIQTTSGVSFEDYQADRVLRLATERRMQHLTNAARRIPSAVQMQYPQVPWGKLEAQRGLINHMECDGRQEVLYRIATHHLREVHEVLRTITMN